MDFSKLDRRTALGVAAAVSCVATLGVTALAYTAYSTWSSSRKVDEIKREARQSKAVPLSKPKRGGQYSQELIDEQLARNRAFLGDEGLAKIRNAHVIVVGAGGVGSWAATMLVRSGVGKVRIIDFDQVTLSSLNRHACATVEDVGTPKVECCAKFLSQVAPFVQVDPVVALWTKDQAKDLLSGDPTYVIDCIDNLDTKVDLLEYCYKELKVPVLSAMGAGCKADPTRTRLADISMTIEDPLSRTVRRRLRQAGIDSGIPVVFSTEKPGKDKAQLLKLEESKVDQGDANEYAVLQDFRVRILPVLGPLPAIFGLTLATHILNELGGYSPVFDPLTGGYSMAGKCRTKLYEHALQALVGQATRLGWLESRKVPLDTTDCGYVMEEVFRGKSPISGESTRLVMSVWDPKRPMDVSNIVPMTKEQLEYHEKHVLKKNTDDALQECYSYNVLNTVHKRFQEEEWFNKFR